MRAYLNFLRSAGLWIAFFASAFALALIEPFFRPFKNDLYARLVKASARMILFCGSVKVTLKGFPRLSADLGLIIAANHQSFLDNLILLGYFPAVFKIVAGDAGFKLPLMRRIYRGCGFIKTGLKMSQEDVVALYSRLKKHDLVLIYGSARKNTPLKFTDAMLHFAERTEVRVLPVKISGASEILPMRGFVLKEGTIELSFGEMIPPQAADQIREKLLIFYT